MMESRRELRTQTLVAGGEAARGVTKVCARDKQTNSQADRAPARYGDAPRPGRQLMDRNDSHCKIAMLLMNRDEDESI